MGGWQGTLVDVDVIMKRGGEHGMGIAMSVCYVLRLKRTGCHAHGWKRQTTSRAQRNIDLPSHCHFRLLGSGRSDECLYHHFFLVG